MANLPQCPNFLEKKGCQRSELKLAGENQKFYTFFCNCCKLMWVWSKPRERAAARYNVELARIEKASAADREASRRTSSFIAPVGGWR